MRTVLLRHALPDGSWHIDWLIEVDGSRAERVPTFRLADRPDDPGVTRFEAEQLGAHRRLYLDYAGEVSGGRGRVEPVASGDVQRASGWPERLDVTVVLSGRLWRWAGRPASGARWVFERLEAAD